MKELNEVEMIDVLGGDASSTGGLNETITDPGEIAAILAAHAQSTAVDPNNAGNGVYYAA